MLKAVGYLVGAGSMTLGVEAAGFKINEVWETKGYSKNATTWDLNRPSIKHQVAELSSDGWLPLKEPVNLIYGNPPCGGVSNMTGCHIDSQTNLCMVQWCQMVVKNQPHMILMENGFQLATPNLEPLLTQLRTILAQAGYYSWVWGPFHSWQIGCPQTRRRMFLCASKTKPKPYLDHLLKLDDLPTDWGDMSVIPYISDLVDVQPSKEPVVTSSGKIVTMHTCDDYANKISELLCQYPDICMERFITPREAEKLKNGSSKDRQLLAEKMSDGLYWHDCPAVFQAMQLFRRPHPTGMTGPAHTILSDFRLVHPTRLRYMTMRECARLTGYPDEWQFHELRPYLLAQGVPAFNSYWAASRMIKVIYGE